MKCIYSALRPPIEPKSYADWITKCDQKLSLSTKGLVAFTSSFCLNQPRPQSVSYHVYVADLNRPYQPYLLLESEHDITILEWDPSGSKLLICDSRGCATIFTSKEFLISDWKPYFEQKFAAESFIAACWYHPGIVSTINVANQNLKTSSNHLEYTDKIQQSKFAASLRLFGGKAAEGCILISRTGLICCLTLMADGFVDVVSESLNLLRMKLHVADVSYHPDGSFIIGASSGSINSTILFYKVNLSIKNITIDDVDSFVGSENKRVNVSCKQYYSFHLNVMSQILNERENASVAFDCVNHIKFVSKDSPNDVLIEVSGQNLSLIELWELETKRRNTVHSAILEIKQSGGLAQTNSIASKSSNETTNGAETTNPSQRQPPDGGDSNASAGGGNNGGGQQQTKEWIFKGNYINTEKNLVAIQVPKFKIFGSNRQLNVIFLAYKDSTIYGLRKEDLQPIGEPLDLSKDVMMSRAGGVRNATNSGLELDSKASYKLYSGQNSRSSGGGTATTPMKTNTVKPSLANGLNNQQNKRKPPVNYITDIQLSTNQTMFVAIDSMSQLHAVKLPPLIACQDSKDEETYLQYMLEYCLVTGNDWWDVLVCSSRDSIETICDKFHDAYERQPKHVQRKYFNRQLMIRASLYRCVNDPASLCKSSECHTMIMLNSISSTLKSMLRSQDQDNPADQLSSLLKSPEMQQNLFDCKKVLAKINEKEFYVESHLIQCLQPLNQWVVDFATYLVASLPQNFKSATAIAVATGTPQQAQYLPGANLTRNKEALEILRELLIIIKIWGKQNPASLPVVYQLNDQLDVIGALFRLISICYSTTANNQQTNSSEPEEQFINECVQFTNNITVTQFEYFLAATGVASPLLEHLGNGDTRLLMEYFQEPTLPELAGLDKIEGSINLNGTRKIDVIRNISLGAYPLTNVRHCTRCRAISLMRPSFNTTRAWEQRWMNTCVCGGHWAQSDGLCSNKVSYLSLLYNTSTTGSLSQLANQLIR